MNDWEEFRERQAAAFDEMVEGFRIAGERLVEMQDTFVREITANLNRDGE